MIRYYQDPLDPAQIATTKDPFISDETYKEMVEKTPIPCTDVALTKKGDQALYLTKRSVYPMKGIWILGGRMWFNDATLHHSIVRCMALETGQQFELSRFKMLPTPHLYSWVKTRQGDSPGKNLAITFQLEVTKNELRKIAENLTEKEYEKEFGIQRFTRERLLSEKCHPALVDLYDEIFA